MKTEFHWKRPRGAKTEFFLLSVLLHGLLFVDTGVTGSEWVTDDAVIIEAKLPKELAHQNSRYKRQLFPGFGGGLFPPGWPFGPGGPVSVSQQQHPQLPGITNIHQQQQQPQQQFPGIIQQPQFPGINNNNIHQYPGITNIQHITQPPSTVSPAGPCLTSNGIYGYCASFRACHPKLYSPEDGHVMNEGLADMYRNQSVTCSSQDPPNLFMFRADAELRQSQICCGGSPQIPSLGFPAINLFPSLTMRPPWALPPRIPTTTMTTTTSTTTTTTPAPQPPPQWPNWPPTHAPTTSSTTARNPWGQWPGPATHPPARPPAVTTTTSPPVASSCGIGKIVGGSQAGPGEFPWLIAIVRNSRQVCGGSLIDSQYILTAAHCFNGVTGAELRSSFKVHIGDYDLHSLSDGPVTVKSIDKLIRHSQFHEQYFYNDIALLKLDSPVQLGSNQNNDIRPICLSTSGNYEGQSAWVAGWGRTSAQNPSQPGKYRKVELRVWNLQQCAATYGSHAPGGITSQMMCAGQQNKDSCLGDSGGPLMQRVGNRWEQIGLVSWGIGCGAYPGVYTKISDYQDWISRNRHY